MITTMDLPGPSSRATSSAPNTAVPVEPPEKIPSSRARRRAVRKESRSETLRTSSITEKSLGAITKGGTTPLQEVIEYGTRPTKRGLVIMDTPGYDIDSMSGLAAGGAQVMLFTTGRGSVAGFPVVPVVKISSNSTTFQKMPGDMDVNAGEVVDEGLTIDEMGRRIFDLTLEVAAGRQTCAENNRSAPFNYLKQGPSF